MSPDAPSIRQKLPESSDADRHADLLSALYVVATPIGNLGDVSARAREVLDRAQTLLCEDTRHTAKLLGALGFESYMPRLERLDAHASESVIARWAEAVSHQGACVALVSDAGTPGVSDPGQRLVAAVHARGGRVIAIPGASAVTAFVSAAGLEGSGFAFWGFLGRDARERDTFWEVQGSGIGIVHVCFESPQRLEISLNWLKKCAEPLGERFRFVAMKELTKLHEAAFTTIDEALAEVKRVGAIGEWVLGWSISRGESGSIAEDDLKSSDWVKALECLIEARVSASEAAKRVSQKFGVPRNRVYAIALSLTASSGA